MPSPISPTTVRVLPAEGVEGDPTCKRGLQKELRKRGFTIIEGGEGVQSGESIIVRYADEWKWDMIMYLRAMDVHFTDSSTGAIKGSAHYKNRFWHTFPDPENVTRRMFEAIDAANGIRRNDDL